jgi:hypothetical protein
MRLAMMTDGHFVPAVDLEAAQPSRFEGVALGDKASLPIAFVVKRGVRAWSVNGKGSAGRSGGAISRLRLS